MSSFCNEQIYVRGRTVIAIHPIQCKATHVIVLNRRTIGDNPRWKKESTITRGASAKLIVEIVNTKDHGLNNLHQWCAVGAWQCHAPTPEITPYKIHDPNWSHDT